MEYTTLGNSGLKVSRIGLGCMGLGSSDWHEWVLDEDESRPIIERAIELGINFFDTADEYSHGESERVLGNVLEGYDRDWPVISTKGYYPTDESNPNARGLSRKALERALEASRDRLGVDTIDLYQIHRWDDETPIEETLRTLNAAVERGKVRYLGASSMWAYQFAEALHTADRLGFERFVSMENHYNLTYREEEREMLPLCQREGIGVIPWSPLARGYLTRPHEAFLETFRGKYMDADEHKSERIGTYRANGGDTINERVEELAIDNDATMAQISIAWLLHKDIVDVPIIGATSVSHLEEAVEAIDITLSDSEIAYLEEPYGPVEINGHE